MRISGEKVKRTEVMDTDPTFPSNANKTAAFAGLSCPLHPHLETTPFSSL